MTRPAFLLMCLLALANCKKAPTPAKLAFDVFSEALGRGNHPGAKAAMAEGATFSYDTKGGELVEGEVKVFGSSTLGVYDWSNATLVKEEVLSDGAHRLEVRVAVCYRSETQGACSHPDVFGMKALMRNEEGAWKVAASTCTIESIR